MDASNILLIGCGPHAKRVYLPATKELEAKYHVRINAVVELKGKEAEVKEAVEKYFQDVTYVFVEKFGKEYAATIPAYVASQLDSIVATAGITGVIIATDPLNHIQYAKWALEQQLHILMDKPISTYEDISYSVTHARQIQNDYYDLLNRYTKATAFIINAQRRFLPQFSIIQNKINEVAKEYGMPISSMQSTHCDGQWRLPNEVLTIKYHPLLGWGKVSHSGYHFIDMASKLIRDSFCVAGKHFTDISVFTKFIRPSGLLCLQSRQDLVKLFGAVYLDYERRSDDELLNLYKQNHEAEMDAFAQVTFYENEIALSHMTLNLIHNGFSRRSWLEPNMKDLYKGNGRLRHEHHNIQQGPLQNIQIHSYQSSDKHDVNSSKDFFLGGNNHYDIYIFRNSGLIGGKPLEVITASDIASAYSLDETKVMNELARHEAVKEFVEVMQGLRGATDTKANYLEHELSAQIMSMIYESAIIKSEVSQAYASSGKGESV